MDLEETVECPSAERDTERSEHVRRSIERSPSSVTESVSGNRVETVVAESVPAFSRRVKFSIGSTRRRGLGSTIQRL